MYIFIYVLTRCIKKLFQILYSISTALNCLIINSYAIETCFDLLSLLCFDFLLFKTRDSHSHFESCSRRESRKAKRKTHKTQKSERVFLNAFDHAILTELNLSDRNNPNNLIIIKNFKYNISYQRTIILRICNFVNYFFCKKSIIL